MTIMDNELISVRNLVNHKVVYKIIELNRRVEFNPYEIKKIPAEELRRLNYQYGGQILLHNYLSVDNLELRKEFNIPEDMVEYDWTFKDIKEALTTKPIAELQDALDFGPDGIKEMLIDMAVELKIPDINRRKAIQDITGVNIDNMIKLKEQAELVDKQNSTQDESTTPSKRRVSSQSAPTGRRVSH